jgi:protease I
VAATKKKTLNSVIHDMAPGWTTYIEKPGYLIDADLSLVNVRAADYVALLLIGGRAPEFLRHQPKVIKLVQEFHRRGKWLFAICHGIQVLITAGVVEGRKVTSYENVRCEVTACGGTWINRQSVVDGNLVTAQNWGSHAEFYRDIFKQLA